MRAVLCERPEKLVLVERPEPQPGEGQVLVRIRRIGVCGTDLHIFTGTQPYFEYPRVMGHELAGEVVEAGPGSTTTPGTQVCIIPYLACGRCGACRRGRTNCCVRLSVLGVHRDGGMAELLVVPESHVLAAPDLSLDQLAMVEFLAIGAHALRRARPAAGDRVLVVGAGPIGIAAAIFAKVQGGHVTMIDLRQDRLDFGRRHLGVDTTLTLAEATDERLVAETDGQMFDLVLDATGHRGSMEKSFTRLGHGGTYVMLGIIRESISFSDPEFHKREATLLATRNATPEDFAEVLRVMRAGKVPTTALASHRATLAEVPEAFASWTRPETGAIKVLIEA